MSRERTPRLIGREDALRQLAAARDRVTPAGGALVLVAGEAGIGKTRLLEEFAARSPEHLVARGGCVDGVAYAPWTDALWWLLESAGPGAADDLPHAVTARLGRLIPSLALAEPEPDPSDDGGQHLLFEAVVELLRRTARTQPLVLVIDDLHWIDPASRDLLRHVAANLRRLPILVIAAFRPEDTTEDRDLIAHLGRLAADRIELARLPADSTAEIATLLLGDDANRDAIERIAHDSDGNPLFVEEFVAALGSEGMPATLRDLMLARFSSLDENARHFVRVAAIIGERAPRAWLAGASGLKADRARAATDAGVLVADDGAYAFRHALLRQAVLDDTLPDELVDLHRTVAQALTDHAEYAVGVDRTAELARHWDAAEAPRPALKWLVAAAKHATETYAVEAAHQDYERALWWWDAVDDAAATAAIDHAALLLDAADAASLAGQVERAADLAQQGMDAAFEIDLNRGVDAVGRAYPLLWLADRTPQLFEFTDRNVKPVLDRVEPSIRARFLVAQTQFLAGNASPAEMQESAAQMVAALDGVADAALVARSHIVSAWCYETAGEYERVSGEYDEAARVARAANEYSTLALALINHASFLGGAPDFERARQLLDEVDELVEHFGFRRYAVYAAQMRAQTECRVGDLEAATRALARVDDRFLNGMETWARAAGHAEIDISRGAFDAVLNGLTPDVVGVPQPQDTEFAIQAAGFRADARAWLGDRQGARRAVDEGESHVKHHPEAFFHGWLAMVGVRIEADAATAGSAEGSLDAVELAQQRAASTIEMWNATLAELVSRSDLVEAQSNAVDAEWARLQDEDAAQSARRAAEKFRAISMPYYETYFRWRESEAMLDAGERPAATEVLKRARAVAIDRGFSGLVDAINALARSNQLRLGPANTTIDGDDALSVRELEVLRLMVDGRSNPEIAEILFISRRTAAAHVSNILRKMDASSRVEAVTEAHRRGVVEG